ncbi:Tumor susceptibility gene 101 protein [Smittium mucronatum]|uniref:Tumor susceptibility gene 101 protein n=1 Tax=Smittium mucronatum TaxID=133383 RepID=A0A1R0GW45_9FUNG|nr:Tumor susceptibility gene 101 protein [Smittium mucronatum]
MDDELQPLLAWLSKICGNMFAKPKKAYKEIEDVLSKWDSLLPRVDEYTSENGSITSLLKLHGTIPVEINNSTFYIPVSIWFPRQFPEISPYVYVVPTESMIIKSNSNVNQRGRVTCEYTNAWDSGQKNVILVGLIHELIDIFSKESPVFSKPRESENIISVLKKNETKKVSGGPAILPSPNPVIRDDAQISQPLQPSVMVQDLSPKKNMDRMESLKNDLAKLNMSTPKIQSSTQDKSEDIQNGSQLQPHSSNNLISSSFTNSKRFNTFKGRPPIPLPPTPIPQTPTPSALNPPPPLPPNPPSLNTIPHNSLPSNSLPPNSLPHNPLRSNPLPSTPISPMQSTESMPQKQDVSKNDKLYLAKPSQEQPQIPIPKNNTSINLNPLVDSANNSGSYSPGKSFNSNYNQDKTNPITVLPQENLSNYSNSKKDVALKSNISLIDSDPINDDENRFLGYKIAIVDKLVESMYEFRELHSKLNHNLLKDCAELQSSSTIASLEEKELESLNNRFDKNIKIMRESIDTLKSRQLEFDNAFKEAMENDPQSVEPECLFVGSNVLSEQLISLDSEIHAYDDALYYLSKIMDSKKIELSVYLSQIKNLSQNQFLKKALAAKIRKKLFPQ